MATVNLSGSAQHTQVTGGISTKASVRDRAVLKWNTSGTLTDYDLLGGTIDLRENSSTSTTLTSGTVYSGVLDLRNGLDNVDWGVGSSSPTVKNGTVLADYGQGVDPS